MLINFVKAFKSLRSVTQPNKFFFREVNSIIVVRFFAADYDSVLEFFPARQDFEIMGLTSVKNGLHCNI
jgi:hypothetical protein